MNISEAREIYKKHFDEDSCSCFLSDINPDCFEAKGFIEGYDQRQAEIDRLKRERDAYRQLLIRATTDDSDSLWFKDVDAEAKRLLEGK